MYFFVEVVHIVTQKTCYVSAGIDSMQLRFYCCLQKHYLQVWADRPYDAILDVHVGEACHVSVHHCTTLDEQLGGGGWGRQDEGGVC